MTPGASRKHGTGPGQSGSDLGLPMSYIGWYRDITLAMPARAGLRVAAQPAARPQKGQPSSRPPGQRSDDSWTLSCPNQTARPSSTA